MIASALENSNNEHIQILPQEVRGNNYFVRNMLHNLHLFNFKGSIEFSNVFSIILFF